MDRSALAFQELRLHRIRAPRRAILPALCRVLIAVLLAAAAAGCKDSKKQAAPAPSQAAAPASVLAPANDAGRTATPERTAVKRAALVHRETVQALLDRWLASQNNGDFDAYAALYAQGFHGVRRSGRKVVRLNREGWLKDRKRMFKHTMTVVLSDVEIAVGSTGADIRFVQDWSSGSYHDVGPKVLRVEKGPDGLRILREEMLSSMLVKGSMDLPVISPQLGLVYQDQLLLSDAPASDWGRGEPSLDAGRVSEQDPECEENPPDYEAEQGRYWDCVNSDPKNKYERYVATRPVEVSALPAELAAWRSKVIKLFGPDGMMCEAMIGEFGIYAEWKATHASASAGGMADNEVATTVLAQGSPILVAKIEGCTGAVFARAADLPLPPQWTVKPADAALTAAALKQLQELYGYQALADGPVRVSTHVHELVPPAGGRRFVVATVEGAPNCHEDGFVAGVWEVKGTPSKPVFALVFEQDNLPFQVRAATDVTGDGIPEIILDDGLLLWQGKEYARSRLLGFTEEVQDPCHCECE